MTKITFYKDKGFYTGYTFEGHAMYNIDGPDILCSAVSMAGQMTLNGLNSIAKVKTDVKVCNGHLAVGFKSESSIAQAFVESLKQAVNMLCKQYDGFLSLSIIERGE